MDQIVGHSMDITLRPNYLSPISFKALDNIEEYGSKALPIIASTWPKDDPGMVPEHETY